MSQKKVEENVQILKDPHAHVWEGAEEWKPETDNEWSKSSVQNWKELNQDSHATQINGSEWIDFSKDSNATHVHDDTNTWAQNDGFYTQPIST
jgi:hypothetical protein